MRIDIDLLGRVPDLLVVLVGVPNNDPSLSDKSNSCPPSHVPPTAASSAYKYNMPDFRVEVKKLNED